MRIVTWTIRLILFLVLAALAAKNIEPVTLRLFFEHTLQAPLAVMLFAVFLLGAACGIFALSTMVFRQRREISMLKKKNFQETLTAPPA
jgi:uncharacterized integral membrane protein